MERWGPGRTKSKFIMGKVVFYLVVWALLIAADRLQAQEQEVPDYRIERLEKKREAIKNSEREALKLKVELINKRVDSGNLSKDEADILKKEAAEKHARNIESKLTIIENYIDLLRRNGEFDLNLDSGMAVLGFGADDEEGDLIFGIKVNRGDQKKLKYDRRTFSNLILGVGLNNAVIDGQSLQDSPYKIGGSRFFELGYAWQTRVLQNSNFLRINYGVSFQFNGLKPKDNQYFVVNGDQTDLEEFQYDLNKSKFRMDNLVFPLHLELGPSKVHYTEKSIRYNTDRQFKIGLGGYAGFNLGSRQKLKYRLDGNRVKDKLKRDYNTNDFVYGLSAYAGIGETMLYVKYDLNPIFNNAEVEQRNISLGFRFQL